MNNSRQNLIKQAEKIIENYSKKTEVEKKNKAYRFMFAAVSIIIFALAAAFAFFK